MLVCASWLCGAVQTRVQYDGLRISANWVLHPGPLRSATDKLQTGCGLGSALLARLSVWANSIYVMGHVWLELQTWDRLSGWTCHPAHKDFLQLLRSARLHPLRRRTSGCVALSGTCGRRRAALHFAWCSPSVMWTGSLWETRPTISISTEIS